jgi:hypothetical protein
MYFNCADQTRKSGVSASPGVTKYFPILTDLPQCLVGLEVSGEYAPDPCTRRVALNLIKRTE